MDCYPFGVGAGHSQWLRNAAWKDGTVQATDQSLQLRQRQWRLRANAVCEWWSGGSIESNPGLGVTWRGV